MSDSETEYEEIEVGKQTTTIDQSELHPLFWDPGYLPEDPQHPDRIAIESFIGEFTPLERAQSCKERGNDRLQFGLKHKQTHVVREAINSYTEGLKFSVENDEFNSVLYSNRAQAHIHLGNWGNALYDCKWAIKKNPKNIKAYYRGAQAAFKLKDFSFSRQFFQQGQQLDPENQDFTSLKLKVEQEQQKHIAQEKQAEQERIKKLKPFKKLAREICRRKLKLTSPSFNLNNQQRPFLDDSGGLHFPVMLVYPETMQQDIIEDAFEMDILADHLDLMFGAIAPPLEWDDKREYTRQRIELYYLSNGGRVMSEEQVVSAMQGQWPEGFQDPGPQRYGSQASSWKLVDESKQLVKILQQSDYVIPGIPIFFVVAKDTEYKKRFLSQV